MNAHEVEAETIDVVFVHPVLHALYHELTHHRLIGSRLVAAPRAIAIGAVSILTIEVVWICALEIGMVNVKGMVIHHIENDTDASLMECLYHLFELTDAYSRIIGIGAVATLRNIVVHRVIAPVILIILQTGLIDRAIVVTGQDMHSINA